MKRTFIAAALALSVGAAFANPDAVVIGAGGAGLSAAVTLHDLGREVVVLEKIQSIKGSKGSMEKKPPQSGAEIYMEVVTAAAGNLS